MPKDRKESTFFAVFWLVGPAGFEPAECGSQSPVPYHLAMAHYCRTANPHANLPFLILNGVGDGTRTHDNRNHNPGLYQLSYTHRSNFCAHITVRKEILRKPAVLSSSKNQFQAALFSREPAPALLTGLFTSLLRELLELRRSKPIVLEHRKHTSRGFDLARIQINHEQLLVNPALCDNHAHRIDHFRGSYGCRPAFAHATMR